MAEQNISIVCFAHCAEKHTKKTFFFERQRKMDYFPEDIPFPFDDADFQRRYQIEPATSLVLNDPTVQAPTPTPLVVPVVAIDDDDDDEVEIVGEVVRDVFGNIVAVVKRSSYADDTSSEDVEILGEPIYDSVGRVIGLFRQ